MRGAFRRKAWRMAFGLAWGAIMLRVAACFFWWLAPVLVGLICGVWLTAWTSRTSAGRIARRWGLLLIPEETAPPRELAALRCANLDALPASAGSSPSVAGGATACRTGVDAARPPPPPAP